MDESEWIDYTNKHIQDCEKIRCGLCRHFHDRPDNRGTTDKGVETMKMKCLCKENEECELCKSPYSIGSDDNE